MSGGYKAYLSNLVPRLARHPDVTALLVGVPKTFDISSWQGESPAVQWLALKSSLAARGREVGRKEREEIERFAPDVIFIPTARYFALNGVPVVNMVQNMMPMMAHNSKYCLERVRNWVRFRQMHVAVERSDRVIAVSHFVKSYLMDHLGVARDKIGVVSFGADHCRDQPLQKPAALLEEIHHSFVFTAGLIYPYRGLEDLIEAWARLRERADPPLLVIAGKVGQGMSRYYSKLRRLVRQQGLDSQIRFVGVLSGSEMAWCYQNCSAFVMTSRVEACPNIALEAMAHGCVSIAADNPPLPEFFADAAIYYPPGQSDRLCERLHEVLNWTENKRDEMGAKALARASRFNWDSCGGETICELQKAIG